MFKHDMNLQVVHARRSQIRYERIHMTVDLGLVVLQQCVKKMTVSRWISFEPLYLATLG